MSTPTGNIFDQVAQETAQKVEQTPSPAPAQPTPAQSPAGGNIFDQVEAEAATKQQASQPENDPQKTGEIVNDVGQKVIVPKDGESFSDTLKRAVAYHKSLTPEQQQAALDAEAKTMPKKTVQTLGAAATIGLVGPAILAGPGELVDAAGLAKNYVLKQLAERSPELFGHEAVKETLRRYALEGAKKAMSGAAWAGGAEILHSIWDDVFGSSKKK